MSDISAHILQAAAALGYDEPKEFQKETVECIFKGQDVFLMAPTGSGKSFVYESTPLVANCQGRTDALVLIISPLTALIDSQITTLKAKGLCAIHFASDDNDIVEIPPACSYIFSSPETILSTRRSLLFSKRIQKSTVALFIDEGHCIIKWGRDDPKTQKVAFRSHYGRIGEIRSLLPESLPVVVMTATATPDARKEIIKIVGMRHWRDIIMSPDRENIHYSLVNLPRYDLYTIFKSAIDDLDTNGVSAERILVYCRKKEQCSDLFELFTNSLGNRGYADGICGDDRTRLFAMFHSKTSDVVKDSVVRSFLDPNGHVRIVFCTVAFGMGIDVKGVNHVVHLGPSNTIEDYVQESGRAGRGSSKQSHALLITYPHATSGNVSPEMKIYCKAKVCRRTILLGSFGFVASGTGEKHTCCGASACSCGQCSQPSNKCMSTTERSIMSILVSENKKNEQKHLAINGDQRQIIHKQLLEYRHELAEGTELFHGVDLTTGFTRKLIDAVIAEVELVSGPEYLMTNFTYLNIKHAQDTWNIICYVLESVDIRDDEFSSSDSDIEQSSRQYRMKPVVILESSDSE